MLNRFKRRNCRKLDAPWPIRPGRGVLFVATQGIGDLVQTLPLLRAVCQRAEGCWPVYLLLGTAQHYEVLREENLRFSPIFFRGTNQDHSAVRLWRQLFRKVDLIICSPDISARKLAVLKYAIAARHAAGEASFPFRRFLISSPARSWMKPWSETLSEIASSLGFKAPLPNTELHLNPLEIEWAKATLAHAGMKRTQFLLGIHCSATISQKRWPAQNFGRLARLIYRRRPGVAVVSFGGAAEASDSQQASLCAGDVPWVEAVGVWNLRQTMAVISQCNAFISGDTGLMHLAAALGVPTVSIFGPTSASRRAPRTHQSIAACPSTACHPCFRGVWANCDCIRSIAPQQVFTLAEPLLQELLCSSNHVVRAAEPEVVGL